MFNTDVITVEIKHGQMFDSSITIYNDDFVIRDCHGHIVHFDEEEAFKLNQHLTTHFTTINSKG